MVIIYSLTWICQLRCDTMNTEVLYDINTVSSSQWALLVLKTSLYQPDHSFRIVTHCGALKEMSPIASYVLNTWSQEGSNWEVELCQGDVILGHVLWGIIAQISLPELAHSLVASCHALPTKMKLPGDCKPGINPFLPYAASAQVFFFLQQ